MLFRKSLFQSSRHRPLSARALACHIAGERMMAAFARLQAFADKAGFNPDQPRAPGGGPGGGQWIYVEGYAQGRQPGMGDNGGPPLDPPEPPKEPKDKPSRLQAAKALAKQILRRAGPVGALLTAIEVAEHYSEIPSITRPIRMHRKHLRNSSRTPANGARAMRTTTSSSKGPAAAKDSRVRRSTAPTMWSACRDIGIMRSRVGITSLTRTSACRHPATICAGRTGPSMSESGTWQCANSECSNEAQEESSSPVKRRNRQSL
jgi:hypothetical protein